MELVAEHMKGGLKREEEREKAFERLDERLLKLFERTQEREDFEEVFPRLAADMVLAWMVQELFDELSRAEEEYLRELEAFGEIPVEELGGVPPIELILENEIMEAKRGARPPSAGKGKASED